MARAYEIPAAFDNATKRDKQGRYVVTVQDFILELEELNHHFSPSQANNWIERYKIGWRLMDEGEYGFNIYTKFNPNQR
ncbi:DNA polymerase V [Sodalis sp. RH22]|uniref:DNA polymerase V n=1 Tax=unclassified Sodalis (in: enterobacteria) TaxID=2636512 RepID=UPI0039B58CCC